MRGKLSRRKEQVWEGNAPGLLLDSSAHMRDSRWSCRTGLLSSLGREGEEGGEGGEGGYNIGKSRGFCYVSGVGLQPLYEGASGVDLYNQRLKLRAELVDICSGARGGGVRLWGHSGRVATCVGGCGSWCEGREGGRGLAV